MNKTLGLDVSTSTIGISIVETKNDGNIVPIFLEHISLSKFKTLWEKVDHTKKWLEELSKKEVAQGIKRIAVEEALIGFRSGLSSAQTITTLIAFNACVRLLMRDIWKFDPYCISSSTARKVAGVKVQKKDKADGKPAKEQVFEYMREHDLSHVQWPLKKQTKPKAGQPEKEPKIVDWARDVTDGYVIAKACHLLFP